ncbi:hypothetical protein CLOM_g4938, partial [Closterium sp. NIES-68]
LSVPRYFSGRHATWPTTRTPSGPLDRTQAWRATNCLDTVAADATRAPEITGPAGLFAGQGIRSTEYDPVRRPDPVHTQERWGL